MLAGVFWLHAGTRTLNLGPNQIGFRYAMHLDLDDARVACAVFPCVYLASPDAFGTRETMRVETSDVPKSAGNCAYCSTSARVLGCQPQTCEIQVRSGLRELYTPSMWRIP